MFRQMLWAFLFFIFGATPSGVFAQQIQPNATTYILDIAWSPDGTQIAVAGGYPGETENQSDTSAHGYISVVDVLTNHLVFVTEPASMFTSIAWSPDGKQLALGSFDGTIWIVNALTGERITNLIGHQATVTDVEWSSDGALLVSTGNWDELMILWDAKSYSSIRYVNFNAHTNTLAFSPDSLSIAVGTESGLFIIPIAGEAQTVAGQETRVLNEWVKQLAYSRDGRYLAIGTIAHTSFITGLRDEAKIILFDLENDTVSQEFKSDLGSISGLVWGLDNQDIAVLNQDNLLTIWSISEGVVIETFSASGIDRYQQSGVAYSPYGGRLAFGNALNNTSPIIDNGVSVLSEGAIHLIVPAPSLDKLNAIAALCVRDSVQRTESVSALTRTPLTMLDGLPDFVAQINALPDGAIPAACKADLLAVAEALTFSQP